MDEIKTILQADRKIKTILSKFKFVKWDRFTEDTPNCQLNFYGWIKRNDSYKDFIALTIFKKDFDIEYITSSAKWDKEICRILKVPIKEQLTCKRVEHYFDIKNSIHLNP